MAAGKKGGKKGRKIGRNKIRKKDKLARYQRKYLTPEGMMGRKIRKLMRHNCMTEAEAFKHWKQNRKRGV